MWTQLFFPGLHCKERFTSFRRNFTVYIVGHHWRHENLTLERYSSSSNILLEKTNRLYLGIIINTDFEGKRPNMIGFSCMKAAVYEWSGPPQQKKNYCTGNSGVSLTRKPTTRKKIPLRLSLIWSDLLLCRDGTSPHCYASRQTCVWNICSLRSIIVEFL